VRSVSGCWAPARAPRPLGQTGSGRRPPEAMCDDSGSRSRSSVQAQRERGSS